MKHYMIQLHLSKLILIIIYSIATNRLTFTLKCQFQMINVQNITHN